jgi:hypothetical protein
MFSGAVSREGEAGSVVMDPILRARNRGVIGARIGNELFMMVSNSDAYSGGQP